MLLRMLIMRMMMSFCLRRGLAGGTTWGGDVAGWGGFHPAEHADDLSGWDPSEYANII